MSLGSLLRRASTGRAISLPVIFWIGSILLLVLPIVGSGLYHFLTATEGHHQRVEIVPSATKLVPRLSVTARKGEENFKSYCQACHGRHARGSKRGPPLIAYDADHHADQTFYKAVQQGVRQHHWRFGDMPAMPKVTTDTVSNIIQFIRELQTVHNEIPREEQ